MACRLETQYVVQCDLCGTEVSLAIRERRVESIEAVRERAHDLDGFQVEEGKDYCPNCYVKLFKPDVLAAAEARILRGAQLSASSQVATHAPETPASGP